MDMTLDEYLAEVDAWKAKAIVELAGMSPEQRAIESRELREWLEARIGTKLPDPTRRSGRSAPSE